MSQLLYPANPMMMLCWKQSLIRHRTKRTTMQRRGKAQPWQIEKHRRARPRKPARPTVIDAKATEVKSTEAPKNLSPFAKPENRTPAPALRQTSGKAPGRPGNPSEQGCQGRHQQCRARPPRVTGNVKRQAWQHTVTSGRISSLSGSLPARASCITGALVATLLAGVAVGGYLYREHGTRLFGSSALRSIDVGAHRRPGAGSYWHRSSQQARRHRHCACPDARHSPTRSPGLSSNWPKPETTTSGPALDASSAGNNQRSF